MDMSFIPGSQTFDCSVCYRDFSRRSDLSKHVQAIHSISFEQYVLEYELNGKHPLCLCGCGQRTDFTPSHGTGFKSYVNGHNWVGKSRSEENKEKLRKINSGESNPNFGNPRRYYPSEKTKKLMSLRRSFYSENHPEWNVGSRNGAWKGGISGQHYEGFSRTLKAFIHIRDRKMCRLCGSRDHLAVHHIDYNKKNPCIDNLIVLCSSCHSKTNFDRYLWQNKFENIMLGVW